MNIVFWFCFAIIVVGIWFSLSSSFSDIGDYFCEKLDQVKEEISKDDEEVTFSSSFEKLCCDALLDFNQTFAVAESCTGGLVSKRITDVPGASQVFKGGIVCYTDDMKQNILKVPESVLRTDDAASIRCAKIMAEQIRLLSGADFGVSVTGVAGLSRDEKDNPVGIVYFGVSTKDETTAYSVDFGYKSRDNIRMAAASAAFDLLHNKILMNHKGDIQ